MKHENEIYIYLQHTIYSILFTKVYNGHSLASVMALFIRGTSLNQSNYQEYLKRIWYHHKHTASYAGPDKLHRLVKTEGKFKIGHKMKHENEIYIYLQHTIYSIFFSKVYNGHSLGSVMALFIRGTSRCR
jgi:hypothetical protein